MSSTLPGGATAESTRAYFVSHPLPHAPRYPRILGRTGLTVSPVGFGGYRVEDRDFHHREALRKALTSGCNLIDTSANYTNGASEILMGQVIHELVAAGKIRREEIVVVTKAGYVQGDNLTLAQKRAENGQPFADMVEYSEDCWHCIHPDYLSDQLTRSLGRLGLERVDALLLHNPEYFLKTSNDHAEYYRRIRRAFEHLEQEADSGRIGWYGVSSNTFIVPREETDYTSLDTLVTIAREVAEARGKPSRFAVIQFPFNLLESGAVLEENNTREDNRALSVLDLAREENLGTLANRPLNAFGPRGLMRLATYPVRVIDVAASALQEAFDEVLKHESAYPAQALGSAGIELPIQTVAWGHILRQHFQRVATLEAWKSALRYQVRPALEEAHVELERAPEGKAWATRHRELCDRLFERVTETLQAKSNETADEIFMTLQGAVPILGTSPTLSRMALRVYLAFPALHCVLMGMREPLYVNDALSLGPPLEAPQALKALHAVQANPPQHQHPHGHA